MICSPGRAIHTFQVMYLLRDLTVLMRMVRASYIIRIIITATEYIILIVEWHYAIEQANWPAYDLMMKSNSMFLMKINKKLPFGSFFTL